MIAVGIRSILVLALQLSLLAAPADSRAPRISDGKVFVHPGISYAQGDLDRMKTMIVFRDKT